MNSNDLLDIIGEARDTYILAAKTEHPQRKRRSVNRLLLIAAVIILILALVGCAVAVIMNLQDMKLGHEVFRYGTHRDPSGGTTPATEAEWDIISLAGFAGSKNFLAARDWYDFKKDYDTDRKIYDSMTEDERTAYSAHGYGCYSQEMVDRLYEICDQYGLEPHNRSWEGANVQEVYDSIGIDGIISHPAEVDSSESGWFYEDGSFHIEGSLTLTDNSDLWPYAVSYQFICVRKTTFYSGELNVGDIESYDQWHHTLPDGTEILLALNSDKALILGETDDCFMAVNVLNPSVTDWNREGWTVMMDRTALEAFADVFSFSFQPQKPDVEAAAAREQARMEQYRKKQEEYLAQHQESIGKESYAARVKYHLEQSAEPERLGFAFMDIDDNGIDELLIGMDGYCIAIYTEADGTTEQFSNAATYCYPCENQTLVSVMVGTNYDYYLGSVVNGISIAETHLRYAPQYSDGNWHRFTSWRDYETITEEAFNSIIDSYVRIPVEMLPLTEYPLEEEIRLDTDQAPMLNGLYEDYQALVLSKLSDSPDHLSRWAFALYDLDGDGENELIWEEDSRGSVYTMTDGRLNQLAYGNDLTVCENGIVRIITHYSGSNKTYCYYHIGNDRTELVEYLRYDEDVDPQNPWFRSTDASGQDNTMQSISEAVFNTVLNSYIPLDLEMKPILEYPIG